MFEGKEILWSNGDEYEAIVVACDYHIGFTIVNRHDHDDYLSCAHGPLSPKWRDRDTLPEVYNNGSWDNMFRIASDMIRQGYFNADKMVSQNRIGAPTAGTCAFQ